MIDQVELLKALAAEEAAENQGLLNAGVTAGAGGGALLGMMAGIPVHTVAKTSGNAINAAKDILAKQQGLTPVAQSNPLKRIKPGFRMAGGLVGLLAGGAVGGGIAKQAISENGQAGEILGSVAAGNPLTPGQKVVLQNAATEYYKNLGIA